MSDVSTAERARRQRRDAIERLEAARAVPAIAHDQTTRLEQLLIRALYEIGYEWAEEQDIAGLCHALRLVDFSESDVAQLRILLESEHADRYA